MDSLNLLFGLSTKIPGASENSITEAALTYLTGQGTTTKIAGIINELLVDDDKTQKHFNEQESDDLSCYNENIKEFTM